MSHDIAITTIKDGQVRESKVINTNDIETHFEYAALSKVDRIIFIYNDGTCLNAKLPVTREQVDGYIVSIKSDIQANQYYASQNTSAHQHISTSGKIMNIINGKIKTVLIALLFLTACSPKPPSIDWNTADTCILKLVAYKTSKASYYWMEEIGTGAIFEFNSLGGRRIPTKKLGFKITSKCAFVMNVRVTNHKMHKRKLVKKYSGPTKIMALNGYEWVTQ